MGTQKAGAYYYEGEAVTCRPMKFPKEIFIMDAGD